MADALGVDMVELVRGTFAWNGCRLPWTETDYPHL
jgi:hypothetical protein